MSTSYSLFCMSCLRHVEVYSLHAHGPQADETDTTHQQLVNFMHDHRSCTLVTVDDNDDRLNDSLRNDTKSYPDKPYPNELL